MTKIKGIFLLSLGAFWMRIYSFVTYGDQEKELLKRSNIKASMKENH
jgi:hypothetical protein